MKAHRKAEQNRTQFQIDRIAFFSDVVIAIAGRTKGSGCAQKLILWQLAVQAFDK